MRSYNNVVLSDATGLSVIGAQITVTQTGSNALATIWAIDDADSKPMENPFRSDGRGEFIFYAADGRYDITIRHGARAVRTVRDIELVDGLSYVRRLEAVENGEPNAPGSLRADLADATGASRLGYSADLDGATPQTSLAVLRRLSSTPQDLGAVGDGYIKPTDAGVVTGTDNSNQIEDWLGRCIELGRPARLPRGRYILKRNLKFQMTPGAVQASIVGDGASCTEIIFQGDYAKNYIEIVGNFPDYDHLRLGGFRITRPDPGSAGLLPGRALSISRFNGFDLFDLRTYRTGGLAVAGSLLGTLRSVISDYDDGGWLFEQGVDVGGNANPSTPNVIQFLAGCLVRQSKRIGVHLSGPTLVTGVLSIENTGTEANNADAIGLLIDNACQAGGAAVNLDLYMEGGTGYLCQITLPGDRMSRYEFGGTANRFGPDERFADFVVIGGASTPFAQATIINKIAHSGYPNNGGYVARPSMPTWQFSTAPGAALLFDDRQAAYVKGEEPTVPVGIAYETRAIRGRVSADGSVISSNKSIVSAVWASGADTGNCVVTFDRDVTGWDFLTQELGAANIDITQTTRPAPNQVTFYRAANGTPSAGMFAIVGSRM